MVSISDTYQIPIRFLDHVPITYLSHSSHYHSDQISNTDQMGDFYCNKIVHHTQLKADVVSNLEVWNLPIIPIIKVAISSS